MIEILGKDKPFIGTSSPLWDTQGGDFVEDMSLEGRKMNTPRGHTELAMKFKGAEGYRTAVLRLPPSVHGDNDPNFIPLIIASSKKAGHAGYVGDGSQKWSAVHVRDAATLYVITLEGLANGSVPPGQTVHAAEDSGHSTKEIAEVIASQLKIDVGSISPQESMDRYNPFIGGLWCGNKVMKSDITRKVTGWQPKEKNLVEDLKTGIYFQ
jgi:nucleoside-diphosphate-sugar epimerase